MKKQIFILALSLINLHFIIAQENDSKIKNGKIGVTFSSFGENYVIRFEEPLGAASYNSDYFYTIGMTYVLPLQKWLEAETGLEYSKHSIIIQPDLPPNMDVTSRKEKISLVNIPITLRANFLKYFFVNGGLFIDIDSSINSPIDNQTGIGAIVGISAKYDFDFGISVFVNPYTKIHSLLPFQLERYPQRILESGVRIGLTYDLTTKK